MKYLLAGFLSLFLSASVISQTVYVLSDNTNLFGKPSAEGKVVSVLCEKHGSRNPEISRYWILIQSPDSMSLTEHLRITDFTGRLLAGVDKTTAHFAFDMEI